MITKHKFLDFFGIAVKGCVCCSCTVNRGWTPSSKPVEFPLLRLRETNPGHVRLEMGARPATQRHYRAVPVVKAER